MSVLKGAIYYGFMFGVGNFFAQTYSAHKASAARRLKGEKRTGERPTGAQMYAILDERSLGENALFGFLAGPLLAKSDRIAPRVFGSLYRSIVPCLCGLGIQQLIVTPLLMVGYFNGVTAMRGGFSDSSFISSHSEGGSGRFKLEGLQWYIGKNVMPEPLLTSWGVYAPLFLFRFIGQTGTTSTLSNILFAAWVAQLSFTQDTKLL